MLDKKQAAAMGEALAQGNRSRARQPSYLFRLYPELEKIPAENRDVALRQAKGRAFRSLPVIVTSGVFLLLFTAMYYSYEPGSGWAGPFLTGLAASTSTWGLVFRWRVRRELLHSDWRGRLPRLSLVASDFESAGYAVVERVVSEEECDRLISSLPAIESSGARTLLSREAFRGLARKLRQDLFPDYLGDLVAVECILFRKSQDHNWAVRLHRDAVLPIGGEGDWQPSGTKEGMECARPPRDFMDRCIALRVHLDGAPVEDISVVPGSHRDSEKHERRSATPIAVGRGGVLIMRPTVAHASSKLEAAQQRRVLHYVFAPQEVPRQYHWYDAA